MADKEFLMARFRELAKISGSREIFTFSDFVSPSDAALAPQCAGGVPFRSWGGMDGCERVMLRFGDEALIGYEIPFPITVIRVRARSERFAEDLTHRDFLGALMHLGIERDVLGDILLRDNCAWVFVKEQIAPFIEEELVSVKHTAVTCTRMEEIPEDVRLRREERLLNVPSVRLDALVARLYHLPRGKAKDLFASGLVLVNGSEAKESASLKEGDAVSVRGFGKFLYAGVEKETKKGRIVARVEVYV